MHHQRARTLWLWVFPLVGWAAGLCLPGLAIPQTAPPPASEVAAPLSPEQQMLRYAPALRQQIMALSPAVRQALQQLQAQHTRQGKGLTLRQVMQEILADYHSIAAAIAVDNGEQAAESARRLANHRMPDGGLLPYFALEKITTETLAVLPAMNAVVEGNALKLAEAAVQGDMATAARLLGDIATGCVACHQVFRGIPGQSSLLGPPPSSQ